MPPFFLNLALLSWRLLACGAYYASNYVDTLHVHSQPSDGPFNSSDGDGYILLM